MNIRLLSLIPVQFQTGREMGIAETVTFFNDMCMMAPATLIDHRIQWLQTQGNKVKASFTTNGITLSAWLIFSDNGELINFISEDRDASMDDGSMQQYPWQTPVKGYHEIKGYRLPTGAEAIYKYPKGEFAYGIFTITNVVYHPTPLQ